MNTETEIAPPLSRWGCLAGFLSDLADEVNRQVLEHHYRTLNDIHSGSIYRSGAFLIRELLCEFIPECISKNFRARVEIASFSISVGEYVKKDLTEIKRTAAPVNWTSVPDTIRFPTDDRQHPLLGSVDPTDVLKVIVAFEYRTPADTGGSLDWKVLKEGIRHAVFTVVQECLVRGAENQTSRDAFFAPGAFRRPAELSTAWFQMLMKKAESSFQNVQRFHESSAGSLRTSLQIMLFFPSAPPELDPRTNGVFFYPVFDPANPNNEETLSWIELNRLAMGTNGNHNVRDTLGIQIAGLVKKLLEIANPGENRDRDSLERFLKISVSSFVIRLLTRCAAGAPADKTETVDPDLVFLRRDLHVLLGLFADFQALKQDVRERIERSGSFADLAKALLTHKRIEIEQAVSEFLKPTPSGSGGRLHNPWDEEWIDQFDLRVFQPVHEGIVGTSVACQMPIRIYDQKVKELELNKRNSFGYIKMGILESPFGIGGGDAPAAVIPLTAKGQTLGALVATRSFPPADAPAFLTEELVSLQYIATWISDIVQEAKDSLVFRILSSQEKPTEVSDTLNRFCRAAAIVTNIRTYQILPVSDSTILSALPCLQHVGYRRWQLLIPKDVWADVKATSQKIEIGYFESDDIVENYRSKIERLYRTILHILGLRASGTSDDPLTVLRQRLSGERVRPDDLLQQRSVFNKIVGDPSEDLGAWQGFDVFPDSHFEKLLKETALLDDTVDSKEGISGRAVTLGHWLLGAFDRFGPEQPAFQRAVLLGMYAFCTLSEDTERSRYSDAWSQGRFDELKVNLKGALKEHARGRI